MAKLSQLITCFGLNILWGIRPRGRRTNSGVSEVRREQKLNTSDDGATLRALLQRFPFWMHGRALLGEVSLRHNDVATAYAEAQALRILARQGSKHQATALFLLGRCFLQRGEAASALKLFTEAHDLSPHDHRIQEERSAACALLGDRAQALTILQTIPSTHLSAESKAAMQWLSGGAAQAQRNN